MGFTMGRWSAENDSYPYKLAADLLAGKCKDVGELVSITIRINDSYKDLQARHGEVLKQLEIAEATVRLLQIESE